MAEQNKSAIQRLAEADGASPEPSLSGSPKRLSRIQQLAAEDGLAAPSSQNKLSQYAQDFKAGFASPIAGALSSAGAYEASDSVRKTATVSGDYAADQRVGAESMAKETTALGKLKVAGQNIARAPGHFLANTAGSLAPYLALGYFGGPSAGVGLSVAQGAGEVKQGVYDNAKEARQTGTLSLREAQAKAEQDASYLGENKGQIALAGGLGFVAGKLGSEAAAMRLAGRSSEQTARAVAGQSLASYTAKEAGIQGATEALQAGQAAHAVNAAADKAGLDAQRRDVLGESIESGLAGALAGGVMAPAGRFQDRRQVKALDERAAALEAERSAAEAAARDALAQAQPADPADPSIDPALGPLSDPQIDPADPSARQPEPEADLFDEISEEDRAFIPESALPPPRPAGPPVQPAAPDAPISSVQNDDGSLSITTPDASGARVQATLDPNDGALSAAAVQGELQSGAITAPALAAEAQRARALADQEALNPPADQPAAPELFLDRSESDARAEALSRQTGQDHVSLSAPSESGAPSFRAAPLSEALSAPDRSPQSDHELILNLAARQGERSGASLSALREQGVDLNAQDASGQTPLTRLIARGEAEPASRLIQAGADLNAADANGLTPLAAAALNQDLKAASALVKAGADPQAVIDQARASGDARLAKFADELEHQRAVAQTFKAAPAQAPQSPPAASEPSAQALAPESAPRAPKPAKAASPAPDEKTARLLKMGAEPLPQEQSQAIANLLNQGGARGSFAPVPHPTQAGSFVVKRQPKAKPAAPAKPKAARASEELDAPQAAPAPVRPALTRAGQKLAIPKGRESQFAETVPEGQGHSASDLSERVKSIFNAKRDGLGDSLNRVIRVRSAAEINAEGDPISPRAKAFAEDDGQVTLIHDQIRKGMTDAEIEGLVLHEVAVHAAYLGLKKDGFEAVKSRFEALLKAGDKSAKAAMARVPANTDASLKIEEAIAYLIEANPKSPAAARVGEWMRQSLRSLAKGLPLNQSGRLYAWINQLTVPELQSMAQRALISHVERESAKTNALTVGEGQLAPDGSVYQIAKSVERSEPKSAPRESRRMSEDKKLTDAIREGDFREGERLVSKAIAAGVSSLDQRLAMEGHLQFALKQDATPLVEKMTSLFDDAKLAKILARSMEGNGYVHDNASVLSFIDAISDPAFPADALKIILRKGVSKQLEPMDVSRQFQTLVQKYISAQGDRYAGMGERASIEEAMIAGDMDKLLELKASMPQADFDEITQDFAEWGGDLPYQSGLALKNIRERDELESLFDEPAAPAPKRSSRRMSSEAARPEDLAFEAIKANDPAALQAAFDSGLRHDQRVGQFNENALEASLVLGLPDLLRVAIDARPGESKLAGSPEFQKNIIQKLLASRGSSEAKEAMARALINAGFDPEAKMGPRRFIEAAAKDNELGIVKILLELGADASARDFNGRSLEELAAKHKAAEVEAYFKRQREANEEKSELEDLLGSKTSNAPKRSSRRMSSTTDPLADAAYLGEIDRVKQLSADIDAIKEGDEAFPALAWAATNGHADVVEALASKYSDADKLKFLSEAAREGSLVGNNADALKALVQSFSDPDIPKAGMLRAFTDGPFGKNPPDDAIAHHLHAIAQDHITQTTERYKGMDPDAGLFEALAAGDVQSAIYFYDQVSKETREDLASYLSTTTNLLEKKTFEGLQAQLERREIEASVAKAAAKDPTPRQARRLSAEQAAEAALDRELTLFKRIQIRYVNKFQPLRDLVKRVEKSGATIADNMNPLIAQDTATGKAGAQFEEFKRKHFAPIAEHLRSTGRSIDELSAYLHARHAFERNAEMARRNKTTKDGLSGMKTAQAIEILGFDLSGMSEADARAELKRRHPEMEKGAELFEALVKDTRARMVESGLASKKEAEGWAKSYKFYAPLKREGFDDKPVISGPAVNNPRGNGVQTAVGSELPVQNILAHAVMDAHKVINRAADNEFRKATAAFIKTHDSKGQIAKLNEPVRDTGGDARFDQREGDLYDSPKKPVAKEDAFGNIEIEYENDPGLGDAPNVVPYRVGGKDFYIVFNEASPNAVAMAGAFRHVDDASKYAVVEYAGKVTAWISQVNTRFNPFFGIKNYTRDFGHAQVALRGTPLSGKNKELARNQIGALKTAFKALRALESNADRSTLTDDERLFISMVNERGVGGGFSASFSDIKTAKKELIRDIDPDWFLKDWKGAVFNKAEWSKPIGRNVEKLASNVMSGLDLWNNTLELSTRFAIYKTALNNGMSAPKAGHLASNLTINFSHRGSDTALIGKFYGFFNAQVQGAAALSRVMFEQDKAGAPRLTRAGKEIVGAGILVGLAQAALIAAAGFDDDEIPEGDKSKNFIIPTGEKTYAAIPMPQGFSVLPGIGRQLHDAAAYGKPLTRLGHAMTSFIDGFSFIGVNGLSAQSIAPTPLDPFVALGENRNGIGGQIAREDARGDDPTPGFTRKKDTATAVAKWLSESLNTVSGGTDFKPGSVSPTPDQIDFVIGAIGGGVVREFMRAQQTASAAVTGEAIEPNKTLLISGYYKNADSKGAVSGRYFEVSTRLNLHQNELEGRKKAGLPVADYLAENPEARLIPFLNLTKTRLMKLREKRKEALDRGDRDGVKLYEERISEAQRALIERHKEAGGG